MKRAALVAVGAATAAACSTAVVVDSVPRGARVTVDGVVGTTPFTARLPITTFGSYPYTAELKGYRTAEGELDRETNPTAIALSVVFPPALLFSVHRAADHVTIHLDPEIPFPAGFAYEVPSGPPLPPLPPGMAEGQASAPATLPSEKRSP